MDRILGLSQHNIRRSLLDNTNPRILYFAPFVLTRIGQRLMGLDVEFRIKSFVEISDDIFDSIRTEFYDAFPDKDEKEHGYRYPEITWGQYPGEEGYILIRELHRYYDNGYERGNWPYIKKLGDWLTIHFGELAEVRYGHDCLYDWEEFIQWGKIRLILDEHWKKYQNEPYRRPWKEMGMM